MLHKAVVLYRRTITFSYIVSANHKSQLCIPKGRLKLGKKELENLLEESMKLR